MRTLHAAGTAAARVVASDRHRVAAADQRERRTEMEAKLRTALETSSDAVRRMEAAEQRSHEHMERERRAHREHVAALEEAQKARDSREDFLKSEVERLEVGCPLADEC